MSIFYGLVTGLQIFLLLLARNHLYRIWPTIRTVRAWRPMRPLSVGASAPLSTGYRKGKRPTERLAPLEQAPAPLAPLEQSVWGFEGSLRPLGHLGFGPPVHAQQPMWHRACGDKGGGGFWVFRQALAVPGLWCCGRALRLSSVLWGLFPFILSPMRRFPHTLARGLTHCVTRLLCFCGR